MPCDDDGFIPVDAHGRVPHLAGVYAAGDGTSFPIKQGGLATQQADAVAQAIAAEAGADVEPEPFRPVLRGMLLTGGDDRYFRHTVAGGDGEGEAAGHTLWWPPTKIAGRYLSGYLFERDEDQTVEEIRAGHIEIDLPLDAHATAGQLLARATRTRPRGVCDELEVDPAGGLGEAEAARRLGLGGPNRLLQPSRAVAARAGRAPVRQLDGAAARRRGGDLGRSSASCSTPAVILAIVVANAVFGAVQEGRADKAAAAVRALLAPTARPARRPRARAPRRHSWPGTSSSLGAGDRSRPTGGCVEATLLQVDESALTGESLPRSKRADPPDPPDAPPAERRTLGPRRHTVARGMGRLSSPPPAPRRRWARIAGAATARPRADAAPGPARPSRQAADPDRGRYLRDARRCSPTSRATRSPTACSSACRSPSRRCPRGCRRW